MFACKHCFTSLQEEINDSRTKFTMPPISVGPFYRIAADGKLNFQLHAKVCRSNSMVLLQVLSENITHPCDIIFCPGVLKCRFGDMESLAALYNNSQYAAQFCESETISAKRIRYFFCFFAQVSPRVGARVSPGNKTQAAL